ncbi:hypothetical protein [Thalassotalea sp. Y01]|uniref:hypothetical protein n=1 Tax=Thalassotalea sp. Y01 TaxID=2729613 RepID=UPI00145D466A|nr:hypothetical protein [Thalassotalea sp. Y01]NMP15170.1 hypothetical protein [Thalassotalea sp. Y01]
MQIIQLILFSFCIAICYYAFSISAIGITAALDTRTLINMEVNSHLIHILKNFVAIGIAAMIPALLIYKYELGRKWICLSLMVIFSMMLHGNVNEMPLSPYGVVRFIEQTLINGDLGAVGVFLEILILPIIWIVVLNKITEFKIPKTSSEEVNQL